LIDEGGGGKILNSNIPAPRVVFSKGISATIFQRKNSFQNEKVLKMGRAKGKENI
jgi:hypothetical protein